LIRHHQVSDVLQSLSDLKTTRTTGTENQNLYSLPGDLSLARSESQQRVRWVEELLQSASDPAALQALQNARKYPDENGPPDWRQRRRRLAETRSFF